MLFSGRSRCGYKGAPRSRYFRSLVALFSGSGVAWKENAFRSVLVARRTTIKISQTSTVDLNAPKTSSLFLTTRPLSSCLFEPQPDLALAARSIASRSRPPPYLTNFCRTLGEMPTSLGSSEATRYACECSNRVSYSSHTELAITPLTFSVPAYDCLSPTSKRRWKPPHSALSRCHRVPFYSRTLSSLPTCLKGPFSRMSVNMKDLLEL